MDVLSQPKQKMHAIERLSAVADAQWRVVETQRLTPHPFSKTG